MVTSERNLTVEEFWQIYPGQPYELIRGEVREIMPSGGESPEIGAIITAHLTLFVIQHKLGKVTNAEGSYWLSENTLKAPYIGFYTWEKHQQHTDPDSFRPFPPDLAVEVVSPSDQAADVEEKVALYLEVGVKLVWVVYPKTRTVMVYHLDGRVQRLTEDQTLDGDTLLPGFQLPVRNCFPEALP